MNVKQAVAKRLEDILKQKGLTQYALSKISGVPQSTISTILKGNIKTIKLSTLFALCKGLGVEFDEFFSAPHLKIENLTDQFEE